MPDPDEHRSFRPYVQASRRTGAEQDQKQGTATGFKTGPGHHSARWRTRQAGEGSPTQRQRWMTGAHPAGTPQQGRSTAAACAWGVAGQGRKHGQGGAGADKPWQPRRGQDRMGERRAASSRRRLQRSGPGTRLGQIMAEESSRHRVARNRDGWCCSLSGHPHGQAASGATRVT